MNEPDPAREAASSASADAEFTPNPEVPVPSRESLRPWRKSRVITSPEAWGAKPVVPGANGPASRRSRWVRWVAIPAGALAGIALIAGGAVWRHYSNEAEKYDLTVLPQLSSGTRVEDREGKFVGTVFAGDRKFLKIHEAPQHLIEAVLATEDSRFHQHNGVDLKGVVRAMMANVTSLSVRQGGSTITQQLARQAFELKGRTLQRKLKETFIARRLEDAYTKDQILEFYLNHIYLGSGFYGMGSAARGYFGKEIGDLAPEESAMLAGIIKAPVSFSPFRSMESAKRVRDLTIERMVTLGYLDAGTGSALKAKPISVKPADSRRERPDYVIAAVEKELEGRAQTGAHEVVKVTVRLDLQNQAAQILKRHIERVESQFAEGAEGQAPLQGAVVVLDNKSGEILATLGGRDYRTSPFDRALQGQRPAGTAFLPVAYASMLSVRPEMASFWVLDGPLDNRRAMVGSVEGVLGEWGNEAAPQVYEGHVAAPYALLRGKTGATVRLGYQAGLDPVRVKMQHCFESPLREQAAVLLGSSAVRPIEMARVFAAIANDGKMPVAPRLSVAVKRRDGSESALSGGTWAPSQLFSPAAAQWVRSVMVAALREPVYAQALGEHSLKNAGVAGYGGTAYGFTDAWFAGADRNVTCVVWMGYDETRAIGREAWAKATAFPLWAELMASATNKQPQGWQVKDEGALCIRSGAVAGPQCLGENSLLMPLTAEMGPLAAPDCLYHDRDGGASGPPAGVAEVFDSRNARPERSKEAVRARPVKAAQPPVVGPDIYSAVRE